MLNKGINVKQYNVVIGSILICLLSLCFFNVKKYFFSLLKFKVR